MGNLKSGKSALIIKWWWPVFGMLYPAGATPKSFKPNFTVTSFE